MLDSHFEILRLFNIWNLGVLKEKEGQHSFIHSMIVWVQDRLLFRECLITYVHCYTLNITYQPQGTVHSHLPLFFFYHNNGDELRAVIRSHTSTHSLFSYMCRCALWHYAVVGASVVLVLSVIRWLTRIEWTKEE